MVELGQAPVDEPELSVFVIDHDVVRFDVPVHDPHAVAVVQSLEKLVQVVPDVVIRQGLVKLFEVRVVDVLEDESGGSKETR